MKVTPMTEHSHHPPVELLHTPEVAEQVRAAYPQLSDFYDRQVAVIPSRIRDDEIGAIRFELPRNDDPMTPLRTIMVEPEKRGGKVAINFHYGGGAAMNLKLGINYLEAIPVSLESDGQVHSYERDGQETISDFITNFDSYVPLIEGARAVALAEVPLRAMRKPSLGSRILGRTVRR